MRPALLLIVFVCGLALGVVGTALFNWPRWSHAGRCTDQVVSRSLSPGRTSAALVYLTTCGAASPSTTSVLIADASAAPRPEDFRNQALFTLTGRRNIQIAWLGDDALSIRFAKDAPVVRQATVWRRHAISYAQIGN